MDARIAPDRLILWGAVFALALASDSAGAQEKFPSKPIEVVTHAGIGGGSDIMARMMMVHAPAEIGGELVIANKVGGAGAPALAYAASRPRDGHTILLITQTHLLTLLQGRGGELKPDEIVALARGTDDPQILMVGKSSPTRSARDFVEASKTKAQRYGTTQIGSVDHLGVIGFAKAAGAQKPTIVPFRGGGDIVLSLVGGDIDAALINYSEAETQIRSGDVLPLMTLTKERLPSLPEVPTATELGIPAVFSTIRGFAVLKGTPEDRIVKLETALQKAMSAKVYQDYLKSSGQSAASVTSRIEWQAQIDDYLKAGKAALEELGAAK